MSNLTAFDRLMQGMDPALTIGEQEDRAAAFEREIREQVACEIETVALGRLDELDVLGCKPSDQARYQEWMDAAVIARGTNQPATEES